MCDNLNDLDNAGASIDHVYIVEPLGKVEHHDLNWMGEIDMIMSEAYDNGIQETEETMEKVKQAAESYWNGTPHYNESVWEYLTTEARIIEELNAIY